MAVRGGEAQETRLGVPLQSSPWQVEFHVVPERVLRGSAGALPAASLLNTRWWEGMPLPLDYAARLDAIAPGGPAAEPGTKRWGDPDGNCLEVRSASGAVTNIVARVDLRRLDTKFSAGLLLLVRHLGAALVRADGPVVEPTIGAFGAALRGTRAWTYANDTAGWIAAHDQDPET